MSQPQQQHQQQPGAHPPMCTFLCLRVCNEYLEIEALFQLQINLMTTTLRGRLEKNSPRVPQKKEESRPCNTGLRMDHSLQKKPKHRLRLVPVICISRIPNAHCPPFIPGPVGKILRMPRRSINTVS